MTTDLILGTAGHIDHGKTTLIGALTGTNTDRLPEEKVRGITIELGFAELMVGDYRLGIVDVPGHEKFVRQMLAGATGMDVALLVVAADDSVKPQTREHMEVLRMLDLPAGVIALTKIDMAEPDWIELVEEEIRELVEGTFFENAPIIRTSATNGEGIDELKAALETAAKTATESERMKRLNGPFRLAIDRSFTIAGHGTVVTGSVSSGQCVSGDQLIIEPGGVEVRVRGLRNHDRVVDSVGRGQRAAINLAGVHHEAVERGQELASIGHLMPSKLVTAQLSQLSSANKPLKNRAHVRVHLGTAETLATVVILDRDVLKPGESAPVQLFLSDSVVSTWNQPFVVRSESPVRTIGGGRVLVPSAKKLTRYDGDTNSNLDKLASSDQKERAAAAVYFLSGQAWDATMLSGLAGITDPESTCDQLLDEGTIIEISISPTRSVRVHKLTLDHIAGRIASALDAMHDHNPLRSLVDRSQLMSRVAYLSDSAVLDFVLKQMAKRKEVRISERGIGLAGRGPKLSNNERKLLVELVKKYREAECQPPTVAECEKSTTKNQQSVRQLIALAATDGDLVEIASDFYLHSDVMEESKATLREEMTEGKGLTMSEIREILKTTRKYAVPICEYLDKIKFTRRDGDVRVLCEAQ